MISHVQRKLEGEKKPLWDNCFSNYAGLMKWPGL